MKSGELDDNIITHTEEHLTEDAIGESSAKIFSRGTLLVALYGATVGKTAILNIEAATNQAICAIFVDEKVLDCVYLRYFLMYIRPELLGKRYGGAQPNISQTVIRGTDIVYPPLAEQRDIARVLSAVQRAIERQERLIALTAELKKALVHRLFTEGTRGEPLKQTEIGPMPESWALEHCDDLCEEISVGVVVRPRSYYMKMGVPAFRSLNVREDRLETDDLVYFSKEVNDGKLSKSKLRAGDVLIVRTGYPGTSCVVPAEYEGSNCIDIVFARPSPRITSEYLSRFFNSDSGRTQATTAKHGLAQQHLNVGAVKRVQVQLPSLEEQCAIVEVLATVDAKRDVHVRTAQIYGVLFRTLLHQLMTTQVRLDDLDLSPLDELAAEPAGVN